nr:hypothetical protein [Pyrinomonadaceae bacterium]
TKNFAGVTGTITLDASRNAVKSAVVLELDPAASKFNFKETIYPEGMTPPTAATTTANSNMTANTTANSNTTNAATNTNSTANTNMANANANTNR